MTACGSYAATATARSRRRSLSSPTSVTTRAAGASNGILAFVVDVNGDGFADIVGFGNEGVWVARNNGNGTFQAPQLVVQDFGYDAGGWRVEQHVRLLADLTGDGRPDIVGFGNDGVWVSFNNGDGTFQPPHEAIANYSVNHGTWRVDRHPRFAADLTGDGRAEIIGFGDPGVFVSINDGSGGF